MIIEQDPRLKVVAEAGNGEEAVRQFENHLIDITLMDIRMPVLSGLEAIRRIRSRRPDAKILVLTTFNDDEYALKALELGACGYLLKDAEPRKLIDAIHSALRGGMILHDTVAAKVMPRLLTRPKAETRTQDLPLTPRERTIVRLVGEGLSNREISDELGLSVGTVKNHISQILQKLELRADAISPRATKPAGSITLKASFRTTSWPSSKPLASTLGWTLTRIARPSTTISAVPSLFARVNTP